MSNDIEAIKFDAQPKSRAVVLREKVKEIEPILKSLLPKSMDVERFTSIILNECRTTKDLIKCDFKSILGGGVTAGRLGLEIGGTLGHCYLIPRKNYKTGMLEASFQLGYRGIIELIYRSGLVSHIQARCRYENDIFEWEYGTKAFLRHIPSEIQSPLKSVYAIATMKDGFHLFLVMYASDLYKIRDKYAPRYNGKIVGPWADNEEEMMKKSVVIRLSKTLPKSVEHQRLFTDDAQNLSDVIEKSPDDIETDIVSDVEDADQVEIEEANVVSADDDAIPPDPNY